MVYRADLCAHVVITSGRCVAGSYEILVSADVARATGWRVGQTAVAQAMAYNRLAQQIPDGVPAAVTIVGIYRPTNPDEVYWGPHGFFPATASGGRTGPIFLNPGTFDLIGHGDAIATLDVIAPPDAFDAARRPALSAQVSAVVDRNTTGGPGAPALTSGIPDFVEQIGSDMAGARALLAVAFVTLLALGWAALHLIVGYSVGGRRTELALTGLRGLGRPRRWWLASGEILAAILAGVPLGYLAGVGVVDLITRTRLGTSAPISTTSAMVAAAAAVAGALLVAALAVSGPLRTRIADQLRDVPGRRVAWRSFAVELPLIVLAAVGVAQLRTGGLPGVGVAVPGLVVAATVVLADRAITPIAAVVARVSLRRGWLGAGLAAVQIGRRSGRQRLFVLVAVAVGLLGFVAATVSVAAAQRAQRAAVTAGAPTVVHVSGITGSRLLAATHAVDPAGIWAMAAVPVDQAASTAAPVLAVDAARLSAVTLPSAGWSAHRAQVALTSAEASPVVLHGPAFTVDAQVTGPAPTAKVTIDFVFVSTADGNSVDAPVTVRRGRRGQVPGTAPACADGCRLTGFTVAGSTDDSLVLTVFGMRTPTATVLDPATLMAAGRWDGAVAGGGGLQVSSTYDPFNTGPTTVSLRDITTAVPTVNTAADVKAVTGPDGRDIDTAPVAVGVSVLPRLGRDGTLVDLATIDGVSLAAASSTDAEVWLGPRAPKTAVAQLRAAGLAVASVSTEGETVRDLTATGPAYALQFHLAAAGLGLLLALGALAAVAFVDRPARSADLRALRRQGLPARVVTRAAVGGYLSIVLAAAVAGLAAAAVAWVLTGAKLPVYGPATSVVTSDSWPDPGSVLTPWALVTALLAAAAIVAGWVLRKSVAADMDAGARRTRPATAAAMPAHRIVAPRGPEPQEGKNVMAGLAVTCRRVVQIYRAEAGDVVALAGVDLTIAPGRDAGAGRSVRLRQVDAGRAAGRSDASVGRAGQHGHL